MAGRLAEADKDLSILLIESGPNNFGDPMVTVPAFWLSHMDPSDKYTWSYKASASPYLAGRESIVPAGRVVSGPEAQSRTHCLLLGSFCSLKAGQKALGGWRSSGPLQC